MGSTSANMVYSYTTKAQRGPAMLCYQTQTNGRSALESLLTASSDANTGNLVNESCRDHHAEIEGECLNITTLVDTNCKKAEEEETSLVIQCAEESDNLKGLLMEEHGNRDESEKSMVRLLDEMYTKLHREVEEERKDRENTQERFIRMLEGLA